jgi:hypothetical protein
VDWQHFSLQEVANHLEDRNMGKIKSKTVPFLFLAILTYLIPANSPAQYQVGQKVQDFTLSDLDGNSVSLYSFAGKKVIVLNFFATW